MIDNTTLDDIRRAVEPVDDWFEGEETTLAKKVHEIVEMLQADRAALLKLQWPWIPVGNGLLPPSSPPSLLPSSPLELVILRDGRWAIFRDVFYDDAPRPHFLCRGVMMPLPLPSPAYWRIQPTPDLPPLPENP
jgi:hypothetical protein